MRTMRFLCWLALPAALLLGGLSTATARPIAEGSAEARQACTPDAMRLCSEFIPNVAKVKACMLRKRAQLSRACRVAMRGGPRRRGHRVRRVVRVRHYHRG
jgi:hypothetical protein